MTEACWGSVNPIGGMIRLVARSVPVSGTIIPIMGNKPLGSALPAPAGLADPQEAERELGMRLVEQPEQGAYDAVVLAVAHSCFKQGGVGAMRALARDGAVVYDTKGVPAKSGIDGRL